MTATKNVALFYFVSSTLAKAGKLTNYYQLNEYLDILTEVNDIPGATGITPRNTNLIKEVGAYKAGNSKGGICLDDPEEQRAAPSTVGSTTTLTLYVTKPFFGGADYSRHPCRFRPGGMERLLINTEPKRAKRHR